MLVKVEGLLRKTWGTLKQWWSLPGVREAGKALTLAAGGFAASAASLRASPQPLALGLILGSGNRKGLCVALGSMAGYRVFWGAGGIQGLWWALIGGILSLLSLPDRGKPIAAMLLVSALGLWFRDTGQAPVYLLRTALAGGCTWVFLRRDRLGRWLQCGAWGLALAQIAPLAGLGLGFVWAAAMMVGASFPAAALAGAGLDLAGISGIPMTAVAVFAWLLRLSELGKRKRWCFPFLAAAALMLLIGKWEWRCLPGLLLGGAAGLLLPASPAVKPRRGETGQAQVRLELAAGVMGEFRQMLLFFPTPAIDREALLQRLRSRSCGSCTMRKNCLESSRLTATVLEDTRDFPCRRGGRMKVELARSREQLRLMKAQRRRAEEYRRAMAQQYRFLEEYLERLSDSLPRRGEKTHCRYAVTVGVRSRGKGSSNGDKWAAFPGSGGRYFVLLCDGMGTGIGAQEEGKRMVSLLRNLLTADFPPEKALRSVNAMLALGGKAGAATVDLAELRLDTGQARLYKWGAAPSWRVKDGKAEKIGTATLPPGLSVTEGREWQGRLSLRRGELLILISDGVDGEEVPRRVYTAPDAPPGELAERLLEGGPERSMDDATAAVIRLRPGNLASS